MLKKTEGLVTLTVCNPNKKDEKTPGDGAESKSNSIISTKSEVKGPSRPITPKPQPSPAKEHHADPLTAEIHANENATIEIVTEKKPLGVIVVGGNDSLVTVSLHFGIFLKVILNDILFLIKKSDWRRYS